MTEKEALEKANRLYDLIVPKLRAVENSGDSGYIHTAINWICKIEGEKTLIEQYKDLDRVYLYYKYLIEAEAWLRTIGENL
jgi:hypothetical protein